MMLTTTNTPIEKYELEGRTVYVKRDDLFGNYPAPRLGKLRGLQVLLKRFSESKVELVGCWDTRVSKLGLGLAAMIQEYSGMTAIVSFPALKGQSPPGSIQLAAQLNGEILPIRGNHVSICYSQVKRIVEQRGGVMLPFGLDCSESVMAVAKEASGLPLHVLGGTLVICSGSGVTLSGIMLGIPYPFKKIIAISSGRSIEKIRACLQKYIDVPDSLDLVPASMPYYQECGASCPFPCDPNYDRKAWNYLVNNIMGFPKPVLFWNIGS